MANNATIYVKVPEAATTTYISNYQTYQHFRYTLTQLIKLIKLTELIIKLSSLTHLQQFRNICRRCPKRPPQILGTANTTTCRCIHNTQLTKPYCSFLISEKMPLSWTTNTTFIRLHQIFLTHMNLRRDVDQMKTSLFLNRTVAKPPAPELERIWPTHSTTYFLLFRYRVILLELRVRGGVRG